MDLTTVTVADFKAQFRRDFPYLPTYSGTALYNSGDIVYYPTTLLFYIALIDGITGIAPNSDTLKWSKYQTSTDNYIGDADISSALTEALTVINQDLFSSDDMLRLGFLYLAAHHLCLNIRASMNGIMSEGGKIVSSRSVGSISESFVVPEAYTKSIALSALSTTSYGVKYLSWISTSLVGNTAGLYRETNP